MQSPLAFAQSTVPRMGNRLFSRRFAKYLTSLSPQGKAQQ
jgi:hypothetical protein